MLPTAITYFSRSRDRTLKFRTWKIHFPIRKVYIFHPRQHVTLEYLLVEGRPVARRLATYATTCCCCCLVLIGAEHRSYQGLKMYLVGGREKDSARQTATAHAEPVARGAQGGEGRDVRGEVLTRPGTTSAFSTLPLGLHPLFL